MNWARVLMLAMKLSETMPSVCELACSHKKLGPTTLLRCTTRYAYQRFCVRVRVSCHDERGLAPRKRAGETVPCQVFGSHHVDGPVDLDYVQEGQNGIESVSVHLGQAVETLSETLYLFLERGTTFERAWVVGQ